MDLPWQSHTAECLQTDGEGGGKEVDPQTAKLDRPDRKDAMWLPSDDDFPLLATSDTPKKTKKLKKERAPTLHWERTRSRTRQATP
jgi:hypothetical protein